MALEHKYMQTDVGLLPVDWDTTPISGIADPVRGASPRPAGDSRYFNGSYIPWLTVASLTNIPASQLVVTETVSCLMEEGARYSRMLQPGTLVISNSGATLGVAKLLGITCCANDGIAALLGLSRDVSPEYLAQYINSKTTYLRDVVAPGNGQPNLNTELIGEFNVPLPPTKGEQVDIAAVLGDTDALIRSLELLVAKQRHLKQGAMQELLTGRRRLPGFDEPWQESPFADIATLRRERTTAGGEFCVELENIVPAKGVLRGSANVAAHSSLKSVFSPGDVLFGKLRAYLRKYWLADRSGVCSTEIWVFTPRVGAISSELLLQTIQTEAFVEAASLSYGTHMPRSDWSVVKELSVSLPPTPAEQLAISTILTDMEMEIAAQEGRLTKLRELQQGMRRQLLTGRIRLA